MLELIVLQGVRTIQLTQGFNTLVDEGDFESLAQQSWAAWKDKNDRVYAGRAEYVRGSGRKGRRQVYAAIHRVVTGAAPGMDVDHRNHDALDNRRDNLRVATRSQNSMNRRKIRGTSQYKGVSRCPATGKWKAQIRKDGRLRYLGVFVEEEDAARVYDKAAVEMFGDFASTNFPA